MKLVVGLGNTGEKYKNTRHNIGFQVVDRLQSTANGEDWREIKKFSAVVSKLKAVDSILVKPQTFMNDSGRAVAALATFYKIQPSDLWVIHDDLDLKLGEYKIQLGVGPKLHYGVQSIDKALGTSNYWRVRVGVDNRSIPNSKFPASPAGRQIPNEKRIPGETYVLQDFGGAEIGMRDRVIDTVIKDLSKHLTL